MKTKMRVLVCLLILCLVFPNFLSVGSLNPQTAQAGTVVVAKNVWAGAMHTLIQKSDNSLWTCGYNEDGELGDGTLANRPTPVKVMDGILTADGGNYHSVAIKADNSLWAWGWNIAGQLGDGSITTRKLPVKIMTSVSKVSAGGFHTMAVKTDNSLWAWGDNYYGALGDGSTLEMRKTPYKVMDGAKAVSAGGAHTLVIKTDNSLWATGDNSFGQLGNGTTNSRNTFVKIMDGVSAVVAGNSYSIALKTDGSVWAWGDNYLGQLGDGTMEEMRKTPVKIMEGVAVIAGNYLSSFAIKTDGSLWGWGVGIFAGAGSMYIEKTPVPVMTNVKAVAAGDMHALVIKADDSLWSWGVNMFGEVGNNSTSETFTPVKIMEGGVNTFSQVSAAYAIISNESPFGTVSERTGTFSKRDDVRPLNPNVKEIAPLTTEQKLNAQNFVAQVGDTRFFWIFSYETGEYEYLTFTLKAVGSQCNVWVRTADYNMSLAEAQSIATEFDTNMYPKLTGVFGAPPNVDGDGKINIVCLDLKDGFDPNYPETGYLAGYFDPNDLFAQSEDNPYSNQTEAVYIDTYPTMGINSTDVTKSFDTIAHEFAHMANVNQNVLIEQNGIDGSLDMWLEEAMAEAASQVYSGVVSDYRMEDYNSSDEIGNGLSLLQWNGYLENYALSYLFGQYIKEQAGIGDAIFTEISQSPYNDYRAVEQAMKAHVDEDLTFGEVMTDFRAALLLKQDDGPYGFMGNEDFDVLQDKIYTGGEISLYGGGAVVIAADPVSGFIKIPDNKGETVRYLLIQDEVIVSGVEEGGVYNAPCTITISNGTATLNGQPFTSGSTVSAVGDYTLVATGGGNEITIHFTIANAILDYTVAGGNLSGITPSSTISAFLAGVDPAAGVTAQVKNASGNVLSGTAKVGTGMTLELRDSANALLASYTLIIYGDMTGDGAISILDLLSIKKHILGQITLTGAYATAGNTNRDVGGITVLDLLAMKKHILGQLLITQ